MDSNFRKHTFLRCLACLALSLSASGVHSAQGFIVGSNIKSGTNIAEISIQFACAVEYLDHLPVGKTDRVRIRIESTTICNGVSPSVAYTREQHRPLGADLAKLVEISYDGDTSSGQALTLAFTEAVSFEIVHSGASNDMAIRVYLNKVSDTPRKDSGAAGVRVIRQPDPKPLYVINLSSSRVRHATSEMQAIAVSPALTIFESEVMLAGTTWYRLRVGNFNSSIEAQVELNRLQGQYPTAWIDRAIDVSAGDNDIRFSESDTDGIEADSVFASIGLDQVDQLMADARRAMIDGEISQAVQIYTKVLRVPNHDRHAEAQEYLAVAREKNGQKAHAKSEYQRYLSLYPDSEGFARVNQRLAALLASDRQIVGPADDPTVANGNSRESKQSSWRLQTFFSQYYRRDVNQLNEQNDVVSQSSLYSDVNFDARRRGQRFDFSSRLSAGYRNNFLDDDRSSGNDTRISYAYVDLADAETGLTGRLGRQSRNDGGVLGRFDGLNLGYQATDRIVVNTVVGIPVNSASDGIDSERMFNGLSVTVSPLLDNLEVGAFYISQDIEGVQDRQAVGGEFRYFGENQNVWGLLDYDTFFDELSNAFLQGSWRVTSHLSLHGSFNRRHSPYLSTANSMIGQPVESFSEMLVLMTAEEIHRLSLDRAPLTSSYTFGVSSSLSPNLQISFDANQSTVDASPESGGVAAAPDSTYRYFSTNLVASSLLKEGDVSMIGLRFSDSDSTKVVSLNLDSRFPFGRGWRINPRIRIDRREILSDGSQEWLFTPGVRLQFRQSQRYNFELEAGKRFSQRDTTTVDLDRESYFFNVGYQAFF